MSKLSLGKARRLQQLASSKGIFVICAMDHRGSLEKMLSAGRSRPVGYQDMVDFKLDMCRALAHHCSAVLMDPLYGAAQAVSAGVLPGNVGLLVAMESSGYSGASQARVSSVLADWNVEKLVRLGAQAAKLLLYYRPDLKELAQRQLEVVSALAEDCLRAEVPLLVEAVAYPANKKEEDARYFAGLRPEIVIETARQITELPIDVFKAEFPADMAYEQDQGRLLDLCRQLSQASRVPWVLLSAGVDFDTFKTQVEIACKGGASGFLGGRALWQEAARIQDRAKQFDFLRTTAADRLKQIAAIAEAHGLPWHRRLGLAPDKLVPAAEGWYREY